MHITTPVPALSEATAARICRELGVESADFRWELEQARRHHGEPGQVGHWACDDRGFYDAARHFTGLVEQELYTAKADDLAHADFRRDAYGED